MYIDVLYKLGFDISYPGSFNPSKDIIETSIRKYINEGKDIMKEYSILYMIDDNDYLNTDYIDIFILYINGKSIRYKHHTLNHNKIIDIGNKCIKYNKDINTYKNRRKQASIKTSNKKFRSKFFDLKGYKCLKCGSINDITIDHIIPVKMGGGDEINNLQPMCRSCNSSKKDK